MAVKALSANISRMAEQIHTIELVLESVVATTRHSRTNDLTTSKALQWAIK